MIEPRTAATSDVEAIKYFIEQLADVITGAMPSLFGAATGENTVGNAEINEIRLCSVLGAVEQCARPLPECARQAVGCAADCREVRKSLSHSRISEWCQ